MDTMDRRSDVLTNIIGTQKSASSRLKLWRKWKAGLNVKLGLKVIFQGRLDFIPSDVR